MNGVPRRQTPRRPAADEYPERRPPPSPGAESERKRRVRGRWRGGSHYFRDYLGSIDGGVVIGFGGVFSGFTCKFAFMYFHVTFK